MKQSTGFCFVALHAHNTIKIAHRCLCVSNKNYSRLLSVLLVMIIICMVTWTTVFTIIHNKSNGRVWSPASHQETKIPWVCLSKLPWEESWSPLLRSPSPLTRMLCFSRYALISFPFSSSWTFNLSTTATSCHIKNKNYTVWRTSNIIAHPRWVDQWKTWITWLSCMQSARDCVWRGTCYTLKFGVMDTQESNKQKTPDIVDGILSIQEFLMSDQLNVDIL